MMGAPDTRVSLLVRLKDRADCEAWQEFTGIYHPVICRLATRKGMQAADAEDLAQQVLTAVAKAIDGWQVDPGRARFRTWLHRITHNLIRNALTRGPRERGSGDTAVVDLLHEQAAPQGPECELVQLEYRRELFRWAARQIRDEFQPETWQAFWQTAVEGHDVADVARQLDRSVGSVYTARSRVMRRLKQKIDELEESAEQ